LELNNDIIATQTTDALERTLASNDLAKETTNGQELIILPNLKRANG
jgi:hypothetical protein